MNSLLFNVVALFAVLYFVRGIRKKEKAATSNVPAAAVAGDVAPEASGPNPWGKRLDIGGVAPIPVTQGDFITSFGMRRANLIDLAVYAKPGTLDSFPDDVRSCLESCYHKGYALGLDTMAMVCHSAPLEDGYGLFFALMHQGASEMPTITAFVDKIKR